MLHRSPGFALSNISSVIAGLVPAISIIIAKHRHLNRDARVKPGHDGEMAGCHAANFRDGAALSTAAMRPPARARQAATNRIAVPAAAEFALAATGFGC